MSVKSKYTHGCGVCSLISNCGCAAVLQVPDLTGYKYSHEYDSCDYHQIVKHDIYDNRDLGVDSFVETILVTYKASLVLSEDRLNAYLADDSR